MKQTLKFSEERGFSLIELMVVIAIIGILASIAVPNYKNYQAKSAYGSTIYEMSGIYTYVMALRVSEGNKVLRQISGSSCTSCPYRIFGGDHLGASPPAATIDAIKRYWGGAEAGRINRDAWKREFLFDENEGEFADCRQDGVFSNGKDFIWEGDQYGAAMAGDDIRLLIPHIVDRGCTSLPKLSIGPDAFL